jgi:hypothetical protein
MIQEKIKNNNNNPETENREASFTKTLSNKTKLALGTPYINPN